MIIKDYQIPKSIDFTDDKLIAFLVYGPNEGLIRHNIQSIKKLFQGDAESEEKLINGKDLEKDKDLLADELLSISMFNEKKIVQIENLREKDFEILKNATSLNSHNTMMIVKSDSLAKSSKIRKFFESDKYFFSLACYEDDTKTLVSTIEKFMKENNLTFNRDIKNYLIQSLSNDRMVCENELEKIKLFYTNSDERVDLNTVKILLNDEGSKNIQIMNESVLYGKTSKSISIIKKLLSEGANPVTLIRSLSNYLKRLKLTKIQVKKGDSFEDAIKSLKPPLFWKDKESFKYICAKWPIEEMERSIYMLMNAEIDCKLDNKLSSILCEKFLIDISVKGKKFSR